MEDDFNLSYVLYNDESLYSHNIDTVTVDRGLFAATQRESLEAVLCSSTGKSLASSSSVSICVMGLVLRQLAAT